MSNPKPGNRVSVQRKKKEVKKSSGKRANSTYRRINGKVELG